jgi:hypothetical protein
MERGEVQGTFANAWSSIKTADPELLTEKKILIIVQHGFKKHPELPDVPLIFDLAETEADRQALAFMLARQEAHQAYFGSPNSGGPLTPEARIDATIPTQDCGYSKPRGHYPDQPWPATSSRHWRSRYLQTPTSVISA